MLLYCSHVGPQFISLQNILYYHWCETYMYTISVHTCEVWGEISGVIILTCRYNALEAALLVHPGPEYVLRLWSPLSESEQHQQ